MRLLNVVAMSCMALLTSAMLGQPKLKTTTAPAQPLPGGTSESPGPMMPLIVPLFLEGNQFSGTLVLVNNTTENTYADVTVRALGGKTLAVKRVNFAPHSQRKLEIGKLLDAPGLAAIAGSIVVMQSPDLAGPAIAAVLAMTYTGSTDPNYIDEEIFMPSMTGSRMLQGVADSGSGSPFLAISSMADVRQHVQIQCFGKNGAGVSRTISLAAGETLITGACSGPDLHNDDFTNVVEQLDEHISGPQGIRLTSDAMPGSFAAFAMVRHHDRGDRFFSSVLFSDPKSLNSPNTVFTGVPVGNAESLLPTGRYVPRLTLANFSDKDIQVQTTFAKTSDDTPTVQDLDALTVPSHTSRELVVPDLRGDSTLQNSFLVHSDGAPGALMAKFVSQGDSRLHEVELQAKDEADMQNAGAHPWSIEDNTESTLLLFNHSKTTQVFTATVSAGGIDWQKEYKLASLQTKAISIRELVEEQIKDDKGQRLPQNSKTGETSWLVTDFAKGSGRLLQSDRSLAMARNFSCGYSGLLCASSFTIVYDVFGNTVLQFGDITGITCTSGLPNACSGARTGTANFSTTWTTQYPNVLSISGSSTNPSVYLKGVSSGSSQINGRIQSQYCSSGQGGTGTGCTVSIVPGSFTAKNCSGQSASQNFNANVSPSLSACLYNGSGSTCTAKSLSGPIDTNNVSCSMSLAPSGTYNYFAGPGTSGQEVGTVQFGFTLDLGGVVNTYSSSAVPVVCP